MTHRSKRRHSSDERSDNGNSDDGSAMLGWMITRPNEDDEPRHVDKRRRRDNIDEVDGGVGTHVVRATTSLPTFNMSGIGAVGSWSTPSSSLSLSGMGSASTGSAPIGSMTMTGIGSTQSFNTGAPQMDVIGATRTYGVAIRDYEEIWNTDADYACLKTVLGSQLHALAYRNDVPLWIDTKHSSIETGKDRRIVVVNPIIGTCILRSMQMREASLRPEERTTTRELARRFLWLGFSRCLDNPIENTGWNQTSGLSNVMTITTFGQTGPFPNWWWHYRAGHSPQAFVGFALMAVDYDADMDLEEIPMSEEGSNYSFGEQIPRTAPRLRLSALLKRIESLYIAAPEEDKEREKAAMKAKGHNALPPGSRAGSLLDLGEAHSSDRDYKDSKHGLEQESKNGVPTPKGVRSTKSTKSRTGSIGFAFVPVAARSIAALGAASFKAHGIPAHVWPMAKIWKTTGKSPVHEPGSEWPNKLDTKLFLPSIVGPDDEVLQAFDTLNTMPMIYLLVKQGFATGLCQPMHDRMAEMRRSRHKSSPVPLFRDLLRALTRKRGGGGGARESEREPGLGLNRGLSHMNPPHRPDGQSAEESKSWSPPDPPAPQFPSLSSPMAAPMQAPTSASLSTTNQTSLSAFPSVNQALTNISASASIRPSAVAVAVTRAAARPKDTTSATSAASAASGAGRGKGGAAKTPNAKRTSRS